MNRSLVICDDDPMVRRVIRSLAERAGFPVVAEADVAVRAVEMVAFHQPGVLILDVSMPGMSGTDAMELVREACGDIRIVLVSAFDLVARETLPGGAYEVLDKSDLDRLPMVLSGIASIAAA